jgi:peptidoglycan/LPS O-acetylase OafA/YrhL
MGMAMLILAPMAVFTTLERIRLCTILGLVIAGLSPAISMIPSANVPSILRGYFFPSYNYFGFFPWASFLAFGLAFGSILRVIKPEDMGRAMQWTLSIGLGLAGIAYYFANLPYSIYAKSEFWLNSPAMVLIKLGVVLVMLAVAYLWVNLGALDKWSIFRQLGTTSLLVYWVHIEIVYGRWFGIWKEGLSVQMVLTFTAVLLALLTLLSVTRTRVKSVGSFFGASAAPAPERAPGG